MAGERVRYSDEDLELETKLLKDAVEREHHVPQNIAIIGQHGCGKSSFINNVMTILRSDGEYHERALVGNFELEGQHVTRRLTRYTKEKYLDSSIAMKYNYPALLDMTGFQNSNDEKIKEVLKSIFQGCIKQGAILNFETRNQQYLPENFQQLLSGDEDNMKIDKIIFVASATSREFPTELIKAVLSQASGGERDMPVFGVLTHADKIGENDAEFAEFEKKFKRCLGLSHLRYLLCTNYCDDVPMTNKHDPDIEVPMIRFMRQVIDPAREVYQDRICETTERLKNMKLKTVLIYMLQVIISTFTHTYQHFTEIEKMIGHSFILAIVTVPFAEYMLREHKNACDETKTIYTSNYNCSCDRIPTSLLNNLAKTNFACQTLTGMNDKVGQLNAQLTDLSHNVSHIVSEHEKERKKREHADKVINELMSLTQQFHNETSGHVKNLGKEIKENLNTTQQHFSFVVEKVRTEMMIETDTTKRIVKDVSTDFRILAGSVVMVLMACVGFCFCFCKEKPKSMLRAPVDESEHNRPKLENTVAVVSFAQTNADLHLTVAKTVTEEFKFDRVILGGVQNISSVKLTSKVAFVFVDKNERNIILETEDDITRTRSEFVQNIIKGGNTQVIVIYCQDEASQDQRRLCNGDLGNVKNHKTLRHLKRQNCVLSINTNFSAYQRDYLKMFLNENLSE